MTIITEFDGLEIKSINLVEDRCRIEFKDSGKVLILENNYKKLEAVVQKSNGYYTVYP